MCSVVISPVLSLSNSQYLALSINRCTNCTIEWSGRCLVSRNFYQRWLTFSLVWYFFLLPRQFLWKSALLDFLDRPSLKFSGLLRIQLLRGISFCFPSLRLSVRFFTLASASKHLIHVFTYSGSSSVVRHPIGDTIVVPWKL